MDLILSKFNSDDNFKGSFNEVLSTVPHILTEPKDKEILIHGHKLKDLKWEHYADKRLSKKRLYFLPPFN